MTTLRELSNAYRNSREFKATAPATRLNTEKALRKVEAYMDRPITDLTKGALMSLMDGMGPGAAYVFGTRLRALFKFAVDRELIAANPVTGVTMPKWGHHRPWETYEVEAFKDADPQVRMGVLLGLYTGQRIGDVVKMRWTDIRQDGTIMVTQEKTGEELLLPLHPELLAALGNHPTRSWAILSQANGDAYSVESFRKKFNRERERLALPDDLRFHGLRKTLACMLAHKGASALEIRAVGGWTSLRQVEEYTRGVRQQELARSAFDRLTS